MLWALGVKPLVSCGPCLTEVCRLDLAVSETGHCLSSGSLSDPGGFFPLDPIGPPPPTAATHAGLLRLVIMCGFLSKMPVSGDPVDPIKQALREGCRG